MPLMLSRLSRKRSRVWLHFSLDSDGIAQCNICRAKLSILGGNVNNLNRHLKSKHPVLPSEDYQPTEPVTIAGSNIHNSENQRIPKIVGEKCKQPPSKYSPDKLSKYDELVDEELCDYPDYVRNDDVRNIVRKIIARAEREKRTLKADLKAETEEKEKYKHNTEKFELISYCNVYQRQLDRFETLFSKEELYNLFPSYGETVKMMVPIFNEERKEKDLLELVFGVRDSLNSFFWNSLTRIEKWRVILLWFYMDQIEIVPSLIKTEDVIEELKTSMKRTVKTHLKLDFENLKNSSRCKPICLLKERCLNSLQIGFKTDIHKLIKFELRGIAVGFSEAYQRCHEETKRFESLSATPKGYLTISKFLTGSTEETEDDYTINICLDLIVKLGRELS